MTIETHHRATLIETAKAELARAHRGARALDAGELRRGLQLALDSLREAATLTPGEGEPAPPLDSHVAALERAMTDLDGGKLAELGNILESTRKALEG